MSENRITKDNKVTNSQNIRTSSSSVYTEPGVSHVGPMDYEQIRQEYLDILGPLNGPKARDIETALSYGVQPSAILDALDQTAMARRPSHYYFRAILSRYMAEGIHTVEDAQQQRHMRQMERNAANRDTWSKWYCEPSDSMPW